MATRSELGEIARDDHGILGSVYTARLLDNPDTVLQRRGRDLQIYEELLRDDQVKSTFEQRRTAVVGAETEVIPASDSPIDIEAADFIREQLAGIAWDSKCDKMLYGIFYGFAVAECMYRRTPTRVELADILVRDRGRFKFDSNNQLNLINIQHPSGLLMPEQKFWHYSAGGSHDDNPYGLGLAHHVYWPVFFKRNDIKFWLIFLEKFGQPTTAARLPAAKAADPLERQKAMRVLGSIQTNGRVVIPEEMTIELIEAARSGAADYDQLYERMDKAISKAVIGQTMTTDDGSSHSQATVHADVADAIRKSDADMLLSSFNCGPVRWLTDWNFPGAGYPKVWRKVEPPEDLASLAERDNKISTLGFEPTEQYIEQTYGPGWVKKAAAPLPPIDGLGPMGPEFAELSRLAQARVDHRGDEQSLVDAAKAFGTKYKELYGDRVDGLLEFLESTDDEVTFRKHLTEMLKEAPNDAAVETIRDATFFSRMMGALRGER
ncbi:DUF935 domain-containing protein [Porticoccaceae bacterium]|nr:DUF935 domain-containing protein [Porticoccaceae bacterium]